MGRRICREGDGVHLKLSIPQTRVLRRPGRRRFPVFQDFGPVQGGKLESKGSLVLPGARLSALSRGTGGFDDGRERAADPPLAAGDGEGIDTVEGEFGPGQEGNAKTSVKGTGQIGPLVQKQADAAEAHVQDSGELFRAPQM